MSVCDAALATPPSLWESLVVSNSCTLFVSRSSVNPSYTLLLKVLKKTVTFTTVVYADDGL